MSILDPYILLNNCKNKKEANSIDPIFNLVSYVSLEFAQVDLVYWAFSLNEVRYHQLILNMVKLS